MKALVEQKDGSYELEEYGKPICGEHFCDTCGDCLVCYSWDTCMFSNTGEHSWVIYRGDE